MMLRLLFAIALALVLTSQTAAAATFKSCGTAEQLFLTNDQQWIVTGPINVAMSQQTALAIARRVRPSVRLTYREVPCAAGWSIARDGANAFTKLTFTRPFWIGLGLHGGPYLGAFRCTYVPYGAEDASVTCRHAPDRYGGAITATFVIGPYGMQW